MIRTNLVQLWHIIQVVDLSLILTMLSHDHDRPISWCPCLFLVFFRPTLEDLRYRRHRLLPIHWNNLEFQKNWFNSLSSIHEGLHIKKGASSRWSSSLYCPMRTSDKMAIGKTSPTLLDQKSSKSKKKDRLLSIPRDNYFDIPFHPFWPSTLDPTQMMVKLTSQFS